MAEMKQPQQQRPQASQWRLSLVSPTRLSLEAGPNGEAPPKNDGDYLHLNFRVLSAAFVPDYYVDFSDQAVLKAAVPMLLRRPVLMDHWFSIKGVTGTVLQTWWGDDDGLGVPGINARLRINRKALPNNLLAEIEADPPLHLAVSCTPYYVWRKSHPKLDDDQFWRLLGSDLNGQTVRMVVTEIFEIPEVSLVWAGADPLARLLEMQKTQTGSVTMSGANPPAGGALPVTGISLAALLPLATRLGLPAEQVADEGKALAALTAKFDELLPLANAGRAHLEARRRECLRLAGLSAPDHKVPEHLAKVVNDGGLETVDALIVQFGGRAAASLTAVCPHCHKAVPVRSSLEAQPPEQAQDQYTEIGLRMAKAVGGPRQAQG